MKRTNKKVAKKIKSEIKEKKDLILLIKENISTILISSFAILCLLAANFDVLFIAIVIVAIFFLYGIFSK